MLVQQPCGDCSGMGNKIADKDRCTACLGVKTVSERKDLEVMVEKGMKQGEKIMFKGEANQLPGGQPGDIVIVLEEKKNTLGFVRKGDHLSLEVEIELVTALTGGEVLVRHFGNRVVKTLVLEGEIIKPGLSHFPFFFFRFFELY